MAEDKTTEAEDQTEGEQHRDTDSKVVQDMKEKFPEALLGTMVAHGEETVLIDRAHIYAILDYLRNDDSHQYNYLSDLSAVDRLYLDDDVRFAVVYHLYSHQSGQRLRIKVPVPESDAHLASASAIWPAANWLEREVYDMYGITFDNHPDLRRLLMPDDFNAHPLRKDYPLHGKGERDNFVF
tara:strand:- start:174 stop:719 length:546 start_codon:yes stop_codon:yes gene_type:complete